MRLKCKLEPKAYNNLLIMKFKVFTFFTLATEPLVSKDSVFLVGIRLAQNHSLKMENPICSVAIEILIFRQKKTLLPYNLRLS